MYESEKPTFLSQGLAGSLTSCVTVGQLLLLPEPQFLTRARGTWWRDEGEMIKEINNFWKSKTYRVLRTNHTLKHTKTSLYR